MAGRGPYAKGVAKRGEILQRALDVVARKGYGGASVKELADEVGLSQAGLLHYFGSKEALFTAILRARDQIDARLAGTSATVPLEEIREGFVAVVEHNSGSPGLVELFSRLSVEAAVSSHPAHDYFLDRSGALRASLSRAIRRAQAQGTVRVDLDADTLARLVQAAVDGLQLQWLQDPAMDMAAATDVMFDLILGETPVRPSSPDNR